jgi:hypothetical protein
MAWLLVQWPAGSREAGCDESAWKLFTKRMDRQAALAKFPDIACEGNRE